MKRITKYMHTLDGRPASYTEWNGEPYLYLCGGRNRVILADSLAQIKREQRSAAYHDLGNSRYGYVLVYVNQF